MSDGADAVTLFVPCYVDLLAPEAGVAAVGVLERLGHRVRYRPDVVCCGQPLVNAGCGDRGGKITRRWIRGMEGAGTVIVLSSSCWSSLREAGVESPGASDGPAIPGAEGSDSGSVRAWEFCQFVDTRHPEASLGRLARTICLHSSCHGLREGGIDQHARRLLARVEELRVVRAERSDECCGFGGTFAVSFPEISVGMGEDRVAGIAATGAREVTATDASCLRHLEGIARAQGRKIVFRHVAEILAEALAGDP